jgi:hypothetical protein
MSFSTTPAKPRDVDNVLLRLPASVRQAAVDDAQASRLPQNTIYAAAVLQWTLVRGVLPRVGCPQNLLNLIDEIDSARSEEFPVVGAFQRNDWVDVQPFLDLLADGGVIAEYRHKVDPKAASTIVYAFVLTKTGRQVWPDLSFAFRNTCERLQEALSDAENCEERS